MSNSPKEIWILRGLPNGTEEWLTIVGMFFNNIEDGKRGLNFHREQFPNWEWKLVTYIIAEVD